MYSFVPNDSEHFFKQQGDSFMCPLLKFDKFVRFYSTWA